ncbi:hypothetical protein MBLNU457_g0733t2 [Dothideomycetes sp. NU457]
MAIEPSDDNVAQVAEFSGCDKDTARRWLKVKNNEVESALMAILEGEDITKAEQSISWDESPFQADRGGTIDPQQTSSYNDANLRPLGTSAAPTRVPSPAPSYRQPTSKAQEDEEMERALALSREGLPFDTAQESGVVTSDGKTQINDHYDPKNWAMVPTSRPIGRFDSSEVVPDPDPSDRKHKGDEPRFLKQLPSGDYLPNFLTILHSIPLAREVLLFQPFAPIDYSHDSDWWRGQDIRLPRIVNFHDASAAEATNGTEEEIIAEMQRLMAFLDASERSYASAESLAKFIHNKPVHDHGVDSCLIDHAICAWELSANTLDPSGKKWDNVFRSVAGTTDPQGMSSPNVWSLPLDTHVDYQSKEDMVTLQEVLDQTLWETNPESEELCENYLEHCAEILTFRVDQHDKTKDKLGLAIPTTLHVDKYLKENLEKTRPIRQQMAQSKRRLIQLNDITNSLKTFSHPETSQQLDASLLMKYVCGLYSGENRKTVLDESEARGVDLSDAVPEPPPEHAAIAQKLDAICESITNKLEVLEQEKTKAREALSQLSNQGLAPTEHRFTLRGVATKPNVTYVLRPKAQEAEQLIDVDSTAEAEADAPPGMQWWRIQYDTNSADVQIHKTVSSQDEVLQAVEVEHNHALLVYASEKAVDFTPSSTLAPALKEFVDRDNAHFAQECSDHAPSWGGGGWNNDDNGWGTGTNNVSRRVSVDSTRVNLDETMGDDEPPPYYPLQSWDNDAPLLDVNEKEPLLDQNQISQVDQGYESPPAHEIRIDEVEDDDPQAPEMVQTGQGSLDHSHSDRRKSDATMLDADREDDIVTHVEEIDESKSKHD